MNKTKLVQAILATMIGLPIAAIASEAELMQRLDKLAAELDKVKAELAATRQKTETVEKRQEAASVSAAAAASSAEATSSGPNTVVTGYGEINYNRPTKDASQAQADVRRAIIGIQHRFDDKTKMVAEFEWEHAVTSASDQGETAIEQLYVEREFNNGLRARAGLLLIPAGFINTNHEPTAYYGVERNFVETAIIPSTWREAGVELSSTLGNGLSWDLGLTTGFNLTKDVSSDSKASLGDLRASPLGTFHQEGQLAKSHDLSVHGALNWRGVPGLVLGGSLFTGKAGHDTAGFPAPNARVTLWDLHARYTPGKWDLSGVYARGTISNLEALNLILVTNSTPNPIPSSFYGWYGQAAYQAWKSADYTLTPFVRYEQFNTAKSFSEVPAGLGVETGPDEKVVTLGTSFKVGEGVVLKADYQKFKEDKARDRVNLGVGYAF
jgi:hypothetical protein